MPNAIVFLFLQLLDIKEPKKTTREPKEPKSRPEKKEFQLDLSIGMKNCRLHYTSVQYLYERNL